MGLKVLHNGTITEYGVNNPGNLGTARLNIRANGSVHKFGLTSDVTASQYCKLAFRLNNKTVRLGTSGQASRQSDYVSSDYYYTYSTYQTQTSSEYRTTVQTRDQVGSTYYTYQAISTRSCSNNAWQYQGATSTNGVWSGAYNNAWSPWVAVGGTYTYPSSQAPIVYDEQHSVGAWSTQNGRFNGGVTSARWRYSYTSSYQTSRKGGQVVTTTWGATYAKNATLTSHYNTTLTSPQYQTYSTRWATRQSWYSTHNFNV